MFVFSSRLIITHTSCSAYIVFILNNQWRIQDFPSGGAPSHWEGADLRCGCFLAKTYAKTKELDPVGGARVGGAPWIRQ